MSKKMLINATLSGEERVAIVEDGLLTELDIEVAGSENTKGNIYKAEVVRIEPGLQAAFVNYGAQRHGFLQIGDIHPDLWPKRDSDKEGNNRRPPINEILRRGQQILVQVVKEERGTKGAAVTTELSLAGRYMVLMANSRSRGISRKIDKDSTRKKIKEALKELNLPDEMGYIIRTAALDQSSEELKRDFNYLFNIYKNIIAQAEKASAPALIYQESSLVLRSVRDYFTQDMDEVLIDDKEIFRQTREFFKTVMPDHVKLVKLHQERRPIFARYQIEEQIAQLAGNSVNLPSGGSIVLDQTEALVAIDVNSGKVSSEQDIESTACLVNVEAATEIARQLRLRDLGGLIVIDFIDMRQRKNARKVEKTLEQALKQDKARITQGRISSQFGLLEMSRQRIKPNLGASSYKSCPHCSGTGRIRSCESRAIGLLRRIQAGTAKGKISRVVSSVALDVGTMLLNQKRAELRELEQQQQIEIWINPRPDFLPDQVDIDFIKDTDSADDTNEEPKALVDIDYGERNQDFEPSPETPPAQEPSARGAEHDTSSDKKDEEDAPKPRSQRRSRSSSRRQRSSRSGANGQNSKDSTTSESNNKESSSATSQNPSEHSNAAQDKISAAADKHKEQASSDSTTDAADKSSAQNQSAKSENTANAAADKTSQTKNKRTSNRRKPAGTRAAQQKSAPSSDTDAKESASESAQTAADATPDAEKPKPRRTPRRSSARKNTAQKTPATPEAAETSAATDTEEEKAGQQDATVKNTEAATTRKRAPRRRPSTKTDSAAGSAQPENADTSPAEKTSAADAVPEPAGASQDTQPPGKTPEGKDSEGEKKTSPSRKRSPRRRSTSTQSKEKSTSAENASGGTEQQSIPQEATTAESSPASDTGKGEGTASPRRRKSATESQASAKSSSSTKADAEAEADSDAQSGTQDKTPKRTPRRRTATPRRKSGTAAESSTAKTAAPDEKQDAGTAADRAAPDGESESGSKTRTAAKRTTRRTGTRRSSKKAAESTGETAPSEAAQTESAKAETPPAEDNPAPKRRRRTAVRKSAVTPKNDDTE
ncbi:MAG: Rne/Rng family ribonuclease [Desulfuromonadaceae bacterium]